MISISKRLLFLFLLTSVKHQDQKACRGKPCSICGPESNRRGTSLSRSLRGMPTWLLCDNKSPSERQPGEREQTPITFTRHIFFSSLQVDYTNRKLEWDFSKGSSFVSSEVRTISKLFKHKEVSPETRICQQMK